MPLQPGWFPVDSSNRHQRLQQMVNDLHALGFQQLRARSLKPKHVEALLVLWCRNQLNVGTITDESNSFWY